MVKGIGGERLKTLGVGAAIMRSGYRSSAHGNGGPGEDMTKHWVGFRVALRNRLKFYNFKNKKKTLGLFMIWIWGLEEEEKVRRTGDTRSCGKVNTWYWVEWKRERERAI